jgi:hypothetical protein
MLGLEWKGVKLISSSLSWCFGYLAAAAAVVVYSLQFAVGRMNVLKTVVAHEQVVEELQVRS